MYETGYKRNVLKEIEKEKWFDTAAEGPPLKTILGLKHRVRGRRYKSTSLGDSLLSRTQRCKEERGKETAFPASAGGIRLVHLPEIQPPQYQTTRDKRKTSNIKTYEV